jgi:hypothetical protein
MAKIFYNIDMAKAVRRLPQPVKNFQMDIVGLPNTLAIRVYEEDVMQYNETKRMEIMSYLLMVKDIIESYGVPCLIDGVRYDPNNPRKFK